jgi:site-specific recombinase
MAKQTLPEYIQLLRLKNYSGEEAIAVLKRITGFIRPPGSVRNAAHINRQCELLCTTLQSDHRLEEAFGHLLAEIFTGADITDLVTDGGIVTGATFSQQLRHMINYKLIPPYREPGAIATVIEEVFEKKRDWRWVSLIPVHYLEYFFEIARKAFAASPSDLNVELTNAARIVSYRIASLGLEKEILIRARKKEELITPFTDQNRELHQYIQAGTGHLLPDHYNAVMRQVSLCRQSLRELNKNSVETGTSINQTFLIRRLTQLVERLAFIMQLLHHPARVTNTQLARIFCQTIYDQKRSNNISSFLSNNLNLLAYRIVEHKKDTGEKYITANRKEYARIFLSACGGGFIVSMLVMIKFLIGEMHLPVFWEGVLYSLNYAVGFSAIQLLYFTLASKQPAMTASVLAGSLRGSRGTVFAELAVVASRVSRSQFISIIGNVLTVFPFTFLWMFLYQEISGVSLVTQQQAAKLLHANHPGYSLSILYAIIAGLFLFMSGIIAGYYENRMVYAKIAERLPEQPFLKKVMPRRMQQWFIKFFARNAGGLMGNISLGIFLGMAAFFGKITGIPFDIRHITFAAGNVMMGIAGGGSTDVLFLSFCVFGVAIIGFFNLFISFLLAFYLAMKARNLRLGDYPKMGRMILRHFIRHPGEFFYPPKNGRSAFAPNRDTAMYTNDLGIS